LAATFALLATGAGFLAEVLAVTLLVALALALGAGAFFATAVLATILDLAGAWAGFFGF
jgi:hypothetical protein